MDIQALVNKLSNQELKEFYDAIGCSMYQRVKQIKYCKFESIIWINTIDTDADGNPETYDIQFIKDGMLYSGPDTTPIDPMDVVHHDMISILQLVKE